MNRRTDLFFLALGVAGAAAMTWACDGWTWLRRRA